MDSVENLEHRVLQDKLVPLALLAQEENQDLKVPKEQEVHLESVVRTVNPEEMETQDKEENKAHKVLRVNLDHQVPTVNQVPEESLDFVENLD